MAAPITLKIYLFIECPRYFYIDNKLGEAKFSHFRAEELIWVNGGILNPSAALPQGDYIIEEKVKKR